MLFIFFRYVIKYFNTLIETLLSEEEYYSTYISDYNIKIVDFDLKVGLPKLFNRDLIEKIMSRPVKYSSDILRQSS